MGPQPACQAGYQGMPHRPFRLGAAAADSWGRLRRVLCGWHLCGSSGHGSPFRNARREIFDRIGRAAQSTAYFSIRTSGLSVPPPKQSQGQQYSVGICLEREGPIRCSTPRRSLRWTLREPRYHVGTRRFSRHAGPQRLGGRRRFTANVFLINQRGPPLLHHDFTIDDDR